MQALLEMSHRRGVIGADEQELMGELIHLTQLKVRDVMIPRVDLKWVDVATAAAAVRERFDESGLGKLIVVDGDLDHVLGLVYRRQFLLTIRRGPQTPLRKLVRGVRFVPEVQRVHQLLAEFRRTGTKFAIAVDEYGGTAGLVALKDIVQRMVGDLEGPRPAPEPRESEVQALGPGLWRVGGRLSVHDWAQYFPPGSLPPRIATLGGLVMALLGTVPRPGQHVELGNVSMEVDSVHRGRVTAVRLRIRSSPGGPAKDGSCP
jgi:putative hemolysin